MKIESLIRRAKGTKVPFGDYQNPDITYHFKPAEPDGPHVAEVEDPRHVERLLSIRPQAFVEAGHDASEYADEGDDTAAEGGDNPGTDTLEIEAGGEDDDADADDLGFLRKQYKAATGRNSSPKWDAATLREKIAHLPPSES